MQRLVEQRLNKRQKMKWSSCMTVNHQALRKKGEKKVESVHCFSRRQKKRQTDLKKLKCPDCKTACVYFMTKAKTDE